MGNTESSSVRVGITEQRGGSGFRRMLLTGSCAVQHLASYRLQPLYSDSHNDAQILKDYISIGGRR